MFLILTVVSVILGSVGGSSFVCPLAPVTPDTSLSGTIPSNSTSLVQVPFNTSCHINFQVPNGYGLKLNVSINSDYTHEKLVHHHVHNEDLSYKYSWFVFDWDYYIMWLPSGNSTLKIEPKGDVWFLVDYSYIRLNEQPVEKISSGSNISLPLPPGRIYSLYSPIGDRLALTVDKKWHNMEHIYVYNSDNLSNATMLGGLFDLLENNTYVSNTSKLVLVNFRNYGNWEGVISVHDSSELFNKTFELTSHKTAEVTKESDKAEANGKRLRRTLNTNPLSHHAEFFDTQRNDNMDNVRSKLMNTHRTINNNMDDFNSKNFDTLQKMNSNMDDFGSKTTDIDQTISYTILGIGIFWLIFWLILMILCVCGPVFLAVWLYKTQCAPSRYQTVNV